MKQLVPNPCVACSTFLHVSPHLLLFAAVFKTLQPNTMADFYEVWLHRDTVLAKLECMLEAREAAREQELKAATDIKRVYRGKVRGSCCVPYCIR